MWEEAVKLLREAELRRQLQNLITKEDYAGAAAVKAEVQDTARVSSSTTGPAGSSPASGQSSGALEEARKSTEDAECKERVELFREAELRRQLQNLLTKGGLRRGRCGQGRAT